MVKATYPFHFVRLLGGVFYLTGMLLMVYNMFRTIAIGRPVVAEIRPVAHAPTSRTKERRTWKVSETG